MASTVEQCREELTSSTRIAAGVILGLGYFIAVLTGGLFVGQTIGEALSTLQTIAYFDNHCLEGRRAFG